MFDLLPDPSFDLVRSLRLRALTDEPEYYASDLSDWESLDDAGWRGKLAGAEVVAIGLSGQPVALAALFRKEGRRMAHRASVGWVFVDGAHRRKGLAERVMAALEIRARALGVWQLELAVAETNGAAITFYRKAGFAEYGRLANGFLSGTGPVADVLMAKVLE